MIRQHGPTLLFHRMSNIDIMLEEPERIAHLWDLTHYACKAFQEAGLNTGKSETPIIPLFVRDDLKAL